MPEAPMPAWRVLLEDLSSLTFYSDQALLDAFPDGDFADLVAKAVELEGTLEAHPVIPLAHAAAATASKVFFADGRQLELTRNCQDFGEIPTHAVAGSPRTLLRAVECPQEKQSSAQRFIVPVVGTKIKLADYNFRARSGYIY